MLISTIGALAMSDWGWAWIVRKLRALNVPEASIQQFEGMRAASLSGAKVTMPTVERANPDEATAPPEAKTK